MALILNIDTATDTGSVCLAKDGIPFGSKVNTQEKDHASVIAPFILELLHENKISFSSIDAVAVSGGPGSYTGLRVGTSTAKGLCYAWNVPLIAISTLQMMANGMMSFEEADVAGLHPVETQDRVSLQENKWFCPMIDARRMEVFTALYGHDLNPVVAPSPVILDENFLNEFRESPVLVFGSGMNKAKKILEGRSAWEFQEFINHAEFLASLSEQAFIAGRFQDVAYFEPWYLKAFHKDFTHS